MAPQPMPATARRVCRTALLAACAAACLAVAGCTAEWGPSRVSVFNYEANLAYPTETCADAGGFLPNVYNNARDSDLNRALWEANAAVNAHVALSGTIGSSSCRFLPKSCVWQWRGGPLSTSPLTFYVGIAGGAIQQAGSNYYYRWAYGFPSRPLDNPRAYFRYYNNEGWDNYLLSTSVHTVVCEHNTAPATSTQRPLPEPTTPTQLPTTTTQPTQQPATTSPRPTAVPGTTRRPQKASSSSFPWWIPIIFAGTAVTTTVLLLTVFFKCCRRTKRSDNPLEDVGADSDEMDIPSRMVSMSFGNDMAYTHSERSGHVGLQPQSSFRGMQGRQLSFATNGTQRRQSYGPDQLPHRVSMSYGGMQQ